MILLYHHVAPPEAERRAGEGWSYCISPEDFERQLREIMHRGYRFVPVLELVAAIERDGGEPPDLAAITFDDGWLDNFTQAFPILRRLGVPATFFITTQHLRQTNEDPRRMNVAQLRQMMQAGMTIGGHSRTHPNLATLSNSEAADEIKGCKADLESALQTPATLFAYPFGAHNPDTVKIVRESGYAAAFSASGGARNAWSGRYWLYRDILSTRLNTKADRRAMSPFYRRITAARRGLRRKLLWRLRAIKKFASASRE